MIRISSIASIILFYNVFSTAYATIIRYDITEFNDTEGNPFSGYVDIDSNYSTNGFRVNYTITDFLFQSAAGICYGSGNLDLWTVSPGMSGILLSPSYIENYIGKNNWQNWHNGHTGVFFDEIKQYDDYTVLPGNIIILGWWFGSMPGQDYWGPDGRCDLTLTRSAAPVPEPATILLLGSGLFGLAGIRKKMKR